MLKGFMLELKRRNFDIAPADCRPFPLFSRTTTRDASAFPKIPTINTPAAQRRT